MGGEHLKGGSQKRKGGRELRANKKGERKIEAPLPKDTAGGDTRIMKITDKKEKKRTERDHKAKPCGH